MRNEPVQLHREPQPNLPKTESVSTLDRGDFIVPWSFTHHVMDAMREPNMSDTDLAMKIIRAGKGSDLVKELKRFNGLSADVAKQLMNTEKISDITNNIDRFNPADHKKIAIDLVRIGRTAILFNSEQNFQHLDQDVFVAILETKTISSVILVMTDNYLKRLGVDPNDAIILLEKHHTTVYPINKISGLNANSAKILAAKRAEDVYTHAKSFAVPEPELDQIISDSVSLNPDYWIRRTSRFKDITSYEGKEHFPLLFQTIMRITRNGLDKDLPLQTKLNFLDTLKQSAPYVLEQKPWVSQPTIEQLLKLQARSANAEHDPWITDLEPLLDYLGQRGIFNLSKPEDGKILVDFVKRFGMSNTPLIARTFFEMHKNGLVFTTEYLGEFLGKKIEPGSKDKSLLNELEQKQRWFLAELLRDQVPKGMETKIGMELLNLIKGSTRWVEADDPVDLIKTWKQTTVEHPEIAKVPEHYVEYQIEVPIVNRRVQTEKEKKDKETLQKEILALNTVNDEGVETRTELGLFLDRLSIASSKKALKLNNQSWPDQCRKLADEICPDFDAKEKLAERKTTLMDKGITGDRLEKSLEAARRAFIVQKEKVQAFRKALNETIYPKTENNGVDEPEGVFVTFMESLAKILPKGPETDTLFLTLSIQHWDRIKQGTRHDELNDITKQMIIQFNTISGQSVFEIEPNTFLDFVKLFTEFVSEHYLQPIQDTKHTGHIPFSPELMKTLESAWTRTGKNPGKEHPFVKARNKLVALEKGEEEVEIGKSKKISLVPAKGILRIFSGDTGDACFTSQHTELAEGEFPGVTAYSFVTNRGTSQERVQGSVLFIETTSTQLFVDDFGNAHEIEKKVLEVRANNPRENLLSQVDSTKLIQETLNIAIDLAVQRGIGMVVVPLDPVTASSSNRNDVRKYYKDTFSKNQKVRLKDQPETNFNGYNNWDPTGNHPVVKIWQREMME